MHDFLNGILKERASLSILSLGAPEVQMDDQPERKRTSLSLEALDG